ncbi:MAG: type VI secretion system-associated protein TagF [Woeseiaceae bacterium]|nr:type VI secretion system-associated protein TagF [Woeseiaceae bacterium]
MTAFYGKLPARGDFITRSLPREFINRWDEWLQSGMNSSRQALGDAWLDTYLTSPLWRFVLPAGICGNTAWAGVLMPSMDKVGRYFPMTVTRQIDGTRSPMCSAVQNPHWFAAVEELLLDALDAESLDLNVFEQSLRDVAFADQDLPPMAPIEAGGSRVALDNSLDVSLSLLGFVRDGVQQSTAGMCFWWGSGSESVAPSLLYTRSLPDPHMFTAMLAGTWSNCGWQDASAGAPSVAEDPLAQLVNQLVD